MNVLSLFDGISCGYQALKNAQIPVTNYFASEIDEKAMKVAKHNHPDIHHIGSVTDVKASDLPKIDLIIGGSPCQGFSLAGKQLNFNDTRSKLFFEYVRLMEETNPKYFFLENNRMKKEYQDVISSYMNTQPLKINSSLLSAQNRNRLYWTNIPNASIPQNQNIHLSSIIGQYDGIWVYPRGFNKGGVQSYNGKSPAITTSSWEHNFFIYKNGQKIKFTPEQCEQLQTLPIGYTSIATPSQRFKMLGNCWTVEVITHLFKGLK